MISIFLFALIGLMFHDLFNSCVVGKEGYRRPRITDLYERYSRIWIVWTSQPKPVTQLCMRDTVHNVTPIFMDFYRTWKSPNKSMHIMKMNATFITPQIMQVNPEDPTYGVSVEQLLFLDSRNNCGVFQVRKGSDAPWCDLRVRNDPGNPSTECVAEFGRRGECGQATVIYSDFCKN